MLLADELRPRFFVWDIQLDANHQASSAHLHDVRNLCVAYGLHEVLAHLSSILHEVLALDNIEDGDGACTSQMVAAEGRAELTIDGRELGADEDGAHGEAVADAFRDGDDVGADAEVLMREELAAASVAALYLVANQDSIVLVAKLLQLLEEVGLDQSDAAHALYAFHDAGADVAPLYLSLPGLDVAQREVGNVAVGIDGRNNLRIRRHFYGQRCAAVEGFLEREDARPAVVERREFQCVLVCLSTAVDEEKAVVLVSAGFAEALRELALQGVLHGVAVETECLQLPRHGLYVVGMAMADADDGMAAVKIEVFLSLAVPDGAALAAGDGHIHQGIYVE